MATTSVPSSKASVKHLLEEFESNGINLPNGIREIQHKEQKPECKVDLVVWKRPSSRKWKPWFSASKADSCDALWRAFKHWGVLCSLDNGTSFVLEAVEKNGVLVGRMENHDGKCQPLEKLSLGVHPLDYDDITRAYRVISKPGKYSKIENNCQEWVIDLLRTMKISVPPQVRTISELIPRVRLLSDIKQNNKNRRGTEQPTSHQPSDPKDEAGLEG